MKKSPPLPENEPQVEGIFSRVGVPPSSDSSPSYRSDVKFRPPRSTAPRANFNETFRAARTSHSASRHLVLTPSVTVRYGPLPPSSSPNARKTMVLAPSVTATPLGLYNNKEPWGWVWLDMNQLSARHPQHCIPDVVAYGVPNEKHVL